MIFCCFAETVLGLPILVMRILTLFCLLYLSAFPCYAAALTVIDDIGRTVALNKPATRIISLAPHITENLFAAGLGHQVVGAVSYSDFPAEARNIPLVGGYDNINTELSLAMQPDLVIAWKEGNQFRQVERLMELGLTVFVNEPRQLEDVAADIIRFGILGGRENEARTVAQAYIAQLSRLRDEYSELERVSVFYQVWPKPLTTVTDKQIIGNVIRLCGGSNIFGGMSALTPQVGTEAVLAKNPDTIIASGMNEARPDWLNEWKQWSFLKAARHDSLYFIDPDIIQRYTPRILVGARKMCEILEQVRKNTGNAGKPGS